ncbi:hypothetical protein GN956_G17332 [Arapaima gigas]
MLSNAVHCTGPVSRRRVRHLRNILDLHVIAELPLPPVKESKPERRQEGGAVVGSCFAHLHLEIDQKAPPREPDSIVPLATASSCRRSPHAQDLRFRFPQKPKIQNGHTGTPRACEESETARDTERSSNSTVMMSDLCVDSGNGHD